MATSSAASLADLEVLEGLAVEEARESFWAFRRYINPRMKLGWWQRELAGRLQRYARMREAGMRPKGSIAAPPQHGKSTTVVEFLAWMAGRDPERKYVYATFSERLTRRCNRQFLRIVRGERFRAVFPDFRVGNTTTQDGEVSLDQIDFVGCRGSLRTTTVGGPITGEELDDGIIDDMFKGRRQANSKVERDRVWDWFTDDFLSRFADDAGFMAVGTHYHVDDAQGRMRAHWGEEFREYNRPAIAVQDEKYRKAGEPLFPEHKSLTFLKERRAVMATHAWESQYQGNPVVIGGNIIRGEWFPSWRELPIPMEYRMVYADTAQKTADANDYSVLQCWGRAGGKIYLVDQLRGKWQSPELKRRAKAFWAKHAAWDSTKYGKLRALKVEDKASGTGLIQELQAEGGFPVLPIPRNVDKFSREQDCEPSMEAGLVVLPDSSVAPWVSDFLAEAEAFTADDSHDHDDQLDPMFDAIEDMLGRGSAAERFLRAL